jgi:hypothetical protein
MRSLKHPAGLLHVLIYVPAGVRADLLCIALGLRSELAVVICLPPGVCPELFRLGLGLNSELAAERILLVEALPNEVVQAAERKPGRELLQMLADRPAVVSTKRSRKVTHDQVAERDPRVGELVFDRLLAGTAVGRVGMRCFRLVGARSNVVPRWDRDTPRRCMDAPRADSAYSRSPTASRAS